MNYVSSAIIQNTWQHAFRSGHPALSVQPAASPANLYASKFVHDIFRRHELHMLKLASTYSQRGSVAVIIKKICTILRDPAVMIWIQWGRFIGQYSFVLLCVSAHYYDTVALIGTVYVKIDVKKHSHRDPLAVFLQQVILRLYRWRIMKVPPYKLHDNLSVIYDI